MSGDRLLLMSAPIGDKTITNTKLVPTFGSTSLKASVNNNVVDVTAVPPVISMTSPTVTGIGGLSYGVLAPMTFFVKNFTYLAAGAPSDVARIDLPFTTTTRYYCPYTTDGVPNFTMTALNYFYATTGTLTGADFFLYTASGAGGTLLGNGLFNTAGTPSAGAVYPFGLSNPMPIGTTSIYIRQSSNAAVAGLASVFVTLFPLT